MDLGAPLAPLVLGLGSLSFAAMILSRADFDFLWKRPLRTDDYAASHLEKPTGEKSRADHKAKHMAIVMDGNRRYGRLRKGNAMSGHWEGGKTLVNVVEWCIEEGLEMLTVYAFSTENWNREETEVETLMTIFVQYATTLLEEALKNNVRVKVLCTDHARLPPKVQASMTELEGKTHACTGFQLNVCLSYGSRAEIALAAKSLAEEVATGTRSPDSIDEAAVASRLATSELPDPDILVRTSGEHRLSNFLLWQLAYTEMFFVNKLWPELTRTDLKDILSQYATRSRRYGT